ncbi:hypothetical protein Syun_011465 [Stephania yunnanensis]|uniref:Uncharacterized protein n=1 Tax=Stephania yunnanensis TaxID=152371 RepID=A0AAP0JZT7_9MAGN
MASRLRSIARPVSNFIKSSINTSKPSSASSFSSSQLPRSCRSERACVLQSLLPLHSAVSTARLTSCLGVDSRNSSSLSQGTLCRANPGV